MRIKCPGTTELALLSWCTFAPKTVDIRVSPIAGAVPVRGADGTIPHLRYTVGRMALRYTQLSGGSAFNETLDTQFQVDLDAGTHTFQQPGSLQLVGGDGRAEIDLAILEETSTVQLPPRKGRPNEDPKESLIISPPSWHSLTILVPAGGTVVIPDYHTRIGAWVSRANTLLEGQPITLGPTAQPCIPGTTFSNPVGADLMIWTLWRG